VEGDWGTMGYWPVSIDVTSDFTKITYCVLCYLHLATLDEYPIARFALEVLLSLNTSIVFAFFLK